MVASNFTESELAGERGEYDEAVHRIKVEYGFDFVSMGLTAFVGAPLKWVYSAGATGERYRRIVLAPGHGIGGIVIKSGKPMMFVDIDEQIDPREYSSYPIVFAEDLHSFCAFPLKKNGYVVAALLCAFRSVNSLHKKVYERLSHDLGGSLCGFEVVSSDFLDFEAIAAQRRNEQIASTALGESDISRIITAQEDERRRISREIHDSVTQDILGVSFLLSRLDPYVEDEPAARVVLEEAKGNIDRIMDDLHNLSVELRPSALDHLGIVAALRARASLFEKTYGAIIVIEDELSARRFDKVLETQIYRICQEAILNACKYSESDIVTVLFEDDDHWLVACVEDCGRGFNVARPEARGSGCGLSGMRERAHLIGATLDIVSDGEGTKVVLKVPLGIASKSGAENAEGTEEGRRG